jgi:hypothetical protein
LLFLELGPVHTPYPPRREGGGVELRLSPSRLELVFFRSGARFGHDYERWACFFLRLWGNKPGQFRVVIPMARNNSTSNVQPAGHMRGHVLANAQIIEFAPYLVRKQEQERERLLARLRSERGGWESEGSSRFQWDPVSRNGTRKSAIGTRN